jgi:putative salt-induced outer membrane protein YdiY
MKKFGIVIAGTLIFAQGIFAADAKWESTVAAGFNLTSGNSDTMAANASINAEKAGEIHEIRLGVEGNFGESTINEIDETTTQNAKAVAVYKRKFNEFFLYSDNSIFHDKMTDVDSRLIIGVGVGRRLFENDNTKFDIELGVAYISEELANDPGDDYVAARIAFRHDQKLSESSKLWLSAEYMPNIDDFEDYLLNGEAGLEATLNSSLSLRVVLQDRYDSTVPADREKNDLSVISSLVYKL